MKKLNVAELLKDCPKGMELDCTIAEDCTLNKVYSNEINTSFPIRIETKNGYELVLTKHGQYLTNEDAKCVIFPKGKTTWEGFQRPFKDGDVVAGGNCYCSWVAIYKGFRDESSYYLHAVYNSLGGFRTDDYGDSRNLRFATKEEEEKLFNAIKRRGYKWNAETKKLEKLIKPMFKVGDIIQDEDGYKVKITEVNLEDKLYEYESVIAKGIGGICFCEQDEWELVRDKFNINTLKPYDRVLVRFGSGDIWRINLLERYDETSNNPFLCIGYHRFKQCIPYEGNEHLLGTHNDCNEFFKTWEE